MSWRRDWPEGPPRPLPRWVQFALGLAGAAWIALFYVMLARSIAG